MRLADSNNTKFAITMFDFLFQLFTFLIESSYCLLDFEAAIIIALLCDKTGLNNAVIKDKVKKLLRMTYDLYDK